VDRLLYLSDGLVPWDRVSFIYSGIQWEADQRCNCCKNSHQLHSLILVSTTAGINEEAARLARAKADDQLAENRLKPCRFSDYVVSTPLFQGIADRGQNFIVKEVLRRLPCNSGLACSLKFFVVAPCPQFGIS